MANKKKYYAVRKGYITGIYDTWSMAEAQVKGYPGAQFKGFFSKEEAQAWLEGNISLAKRKAIAPKKQLNTRGIDCSEADIIIYTDGGAINNPGPGGYGVVLKHGEEQEELFGGFRLTTNNRMELMACIVALQETQYSSKKIVLFSDSSYVVNGISKGWVKKWQRNGWLKSDKKPVVNRDLWERLVLLSDSLDIDFRWVKGHSGNPLNERCDQLAVKSARGSGLPSDAGYESTLATNNKGR